LNDDTIISRLENLKKEAAEISRKVAETDQVMKEVDTVINQYLGLSQACSSIYFTMDVLYQIHSLYQYSIQYFLEIFNTVLSQNPNLRDVKDPQSRLKIIARDLFYLAYYRIARGMLQDDRIVLGLLLAKIYLRGFMKNAGESASTEAYFRTLMNSNVSGLLDADTSLDGVGKVGTTKHVLNGEQLEAVNYLSKNPEFSQLKSALKDNAQEFYSWLESPNPEKMIPEVLWQSGKPISTQPSSAGKNQFNLFKDCY
jgi:dynein heavy chain 1